MYNYFVLAEHLHKTVEEVMNMSLAEVNGWFAYLELKKEKRHG